MDLATWTARTTPDNKVSVVDVIAHVRGVTTKHAAMMYRRLCDEDRAPKCELQHLPPRCNTLGDAGGYPQSNNPKRRGGFTHEQAGPVATAAEMVEIIWALPGNTDFRRNCARIAVRYLGGDETLINEIQMNRRAQECLAQTTPGHPARVFGGGCGGSNSKTDAPGHHGARRTNQSLEASLH